MTLPFESSRPTGSMRAVSSARNIIANYVGGGYAALVQIAFMPLYIKSLGLEAFGLIGFYMSLQAMMALMDMGMTPAMTREMARHRAGTYTIEQMRALLRTIEFVYAVLAALMFLMVAAASSWLATEWLNSATLRAPVIAHAIVLMGVLISLQWLTGLYRGAILGLQQQVWLNGENVIFSTLRAVGILLVLHWVEASLAAFFIYQALVAFIEVLVLMWKTWSLLPGFTRPAFSSAALRRVWRFSAGVTLITGLSLLLTQSDKVILSRLLPLREFGYYVLASSAATGLLVLVAPLVNVAYPRFTELVARGEQPALAATYHRFSQALCLIVVPAGLMLVAFSGRILLLWTHDSATAAAAGPLVSLLGIGYMLSGLMHTPYNLQLAFGWTRFSVVTNVICTMVFIPALYFGVSNYGALAAGYTWIGLNASYVIFTLPLMHKRILPGELMHWYTADLIYPVGAALGALVVMKLLLPPSMPNTAGVSIGLIGATYAAAALSASFATPLGRQMLSRLYWLARRFVGSPVY